MGKNSNKEDGGCWGGKRIFFLDFCLFEFFMLCVVFVCACSFVFFYLVSCHSSRLAFSLSLTPLTSSCLQSASCKICVCVCMCVCVCVPACLCVCVSACTHTHTHIYLRHACMHVHWYVCVFGGWGADVWWQICVCQYCMLWCRLLIIFIIFKFEYKMYAPRAHLKKGAQRPHYYSSCFYCLLLLLLIFR